MYTMTPFNGMQNPFLVIRTVFLALLLYINVLILVFAGWNLSVIGGSVPGAPVFLLINSCFIFVFLTLAGIAEAICPKARPAHVRVECAWTTLMSTLQLASSINTSINGRPAICQTRWSWAPCASSDLLVPVSWAASLIVLTYCLTICFTAFAHAHLIPNMWTMNVSSVPWFNVDTKGQPSIETLKVPAGMESKSLRRLTLTSEQSCPVSKYISERWGKLSNAERQSGLGPNAIWFGNGHKSVDSTRPTWARQLDTRRGVDQPFSRPPPLPVVRNVQPPLPPQVVPREVAPLNVGHDVEIRRVSEMRSSDGHSFHSETPTMFPKGISDPDLPIPLPHRSHWVSVGPPKPGYF